MCAAPSCDVHLADSHRADMLSIVPEEWDSLNARAREAQAELSRLSAELSSVRGSEGTLRVSVHTCVEPPRSPLM